VPRSRATSPGAPCSDCASHKHWPRIDGKILRADKAGTTKLNGTAKHDQLMGHHSSDTLRGKAKGDILWGDFDPVGQPASQVDTIYGGGGNDFIYGSHGRNVIYGGAGNDAISVHYGRGMVDCGPGRDIYHVARSRRKGYKFKNCERVDLRPEKVRAAA
jgi:Ca2+-binding RTX toxin-like protein